MMDLFGKSTFIILTRLIRTHQETAAAATILTRPSTHPWDAALIQTDPSGRITELVHEREQGRHYRNLGNGAIYCISKQILKLIPEECKSDFMKDIFPAAIARGLRLQSSVIEPEGFIKDMGTPQGLASVERHIRQRREIEEAHSNPAPINTVFLDRDGVLNEDTDLIKHPDELRILPGVPEAIKLFNDHGIRTVVITNQPVIARGLCNAQTVDEIHMKLKRELAKAGARLDAIYYCPHHPETHHGNGVIELRRACDCRKPNIGMIMQAKEELGLRLGACMMIGDSSVDILTGKRAGLRTVLLQTGKGRITDDAAPDYTFKDLLEAAQAITQAAVTGDAQ
jgi:histidinol-phosphate phosphatase family protein